PSEAPERRLLRDFGSADIQEGRELRQRGRQAQEVRPGGRRPGRSAEGEGSRRPLRGRADHLAAVPGPAGVEQAGAGPGRGEHAPLRAGDKELPGVPRAGRRRGAEGKLAPHRAPLWYSTTPAEFGFKRPAPPKRNPGDPPPNMDKLMEEATTKFLSENGDKIK